MSCPSSLPCTGSAGPLARHRVAPALAPGCVPGCARMGGVVLPAQQLPLPAAPLPAAPAPAPASLRSPPGWSREQMAAPRATRRPPTLPSLPPWPGPCRLPAGPGLRAGKLHGVGGGLLGNDRGRRGLGGIPSLCFSPSEGLLDHS